MSRRRVVVTGAQGFLGRHVVAAFLASGDTEVVGVGRSPRSDACFTHDLAWLDGRVPAPLGPLRPPSADDAYRYLVADLGSDEGQATLRAVGPDVVIHAAAALRDDPWPVLRAANLDSVVGLFRALEPDAGPRPHVVAVSSGSVYGAVPPASSAGSGHTLATGTVHCCQLAPRGSVDGAPSSRTRNVRF